MVICFLANYNFFTDLYIKFSEKWDKTPSHYIEVQLICSIYHIRFGDYKKNFWKMRQIVLRSVPSIYKKKGGMYMKKNLESLFRELFYVVFEAALNWLYSSGHINILIAIAFFIIGYLVATFINKYF